MKEFEASFSAAHEPTMEELRSVAARAMGLPVARVATVVPLKRSLDARGKEIQYRYRLMGYEVGEQGPQPRRQFVYQQVQAAEPVLVIGAGPAGHFCALKLLQQGFRPILIERGKDVHARKYDMAKLSREGLVNPDSNYCFGEGGAGTFSDGKLYTRSSKRGDIYEVLEQLVLFGADEKILLEAHPHVGSDKLSAIIENIRLCIEAHGGAYHFNRRVERLRKTDTGWVVTAACVDPLEVGEAAGTEDFEARYVVLATGHSGKEIYEFFDQQGWSLEAKGFALGVRAEHPQALINNARYHGMYRPYLPPAEYALVTQVEGRGVFSFCMCPGGLLIPSATAPGEQVLNGMSNSNRSSKWANAGIVVAVEPEDLSDYQKYGALASLRFQQDVERAMYNVTGSMRAPAQRMTDFVRRKVSVDLPKSSYHPGTSSQPLHELLPSFVADRLRKAFPEFDRKIRGYYTSEALLLAVESRTSSPVRIPRDPETLESLSCPGVYPCGEGAGYAGGIVSSALDGIRVAQSIAEAAGLLKNN